MENNLNEDVKDSSIRDFKSSHSSIKSIKSLEKHNTSGSIKLEKQTIQFKNDHTDNNLKHHHDHFTNEGSIKVPHKFIANWRHACDKTKDKTKDLLKRWRTLPEIETNHIKKEEITEESHSESGWSVHVWTTWVDRFSIDSDNNDKENNCQLTPIQNHKFSHFFSSLLDHDQDNLINEDDVEAFIERLRHFADWSKNSTEYNILREVEHGFKDTFLINLPEADAKLGFTIKNKIYISKEAWLIKWSKIVVNSKNLSDFPIWLQFFSKILFQTINRSGNGIITKDELSAFYSSVLLLSVDKTNEILNMAYQSMTSNGDHPLMYRAYRLCFANYLLGRYPNGPGQYILGAPPNILSTTLFPVDYSALNAQPEDLEQYTPDQKSNRRSIIV